MRWREQIAEHDRDTRLPGFSDAVTRTFDAPEALKARFHEIHAKSALNRVPGASRVPFAWTVNPYRGCAHACTYCTSGDTRVLMGDGRTRRMADLRAGDVVYGTEQRGGCRRYVRTTVLDHWSTVRPAFRTLLADGTELVTSGDHRLLSNRGWKYVSGGMSGPEPRPYLTARTRLIGTGRFAATATAGREYRIGYLCGMVRADAGLATLADHEALDRTAYYLAQEAVDTARSALGGANARRRASRGATEGLVRWPLDPGDDWRRGFLAGIFDAAGSRSSAIRVAHSDTAILAWTSACLRHFGFDVVLEDPQPPSGFCNVRLRGGLREQLRFFHLTDPAITRKRDIGGLSLKSDADLRVVSVEPLGKAMRLYDVTTGTGDYIGDGVVHHNCFARPTHEYLGFDAGKDFDEQIVVKVNAPEVLRAELKRPSWKGEHVALGTNTDPYQWVERRYGLTRAILETLRDARNPCSVLTKSPLLLRDLEIFLELLEVTEFSACLSIPTLDEQAWRATEPHTPHPRKRLEAVAALNAAGVPTGVLIAPLMPGINDSPAQLEALVRACEEAGAVRIGGQSLFLRGATKDVFLGWLGRARPDLVPLYDELYGPRAYLREPDKRRTEARLRELTGRAPAKAELAARFQRGAPLQSAGHAVAEAERRSAPPRPAVRQESLF